MRLVKHVWVSKELQILEPVLNKWLEECQRYMEVMDDSDVCWWYNERANTSIFAVAAAKVGGWVALEEFPTRKRTKSNDKSGKPDGNGRCDLYVANKDTGIAIEFKQAWQSLFPTNESRYPRIDHAWEAAWRASGELFPYEADKRLAGLFVVPDYPEAKKDSYLGNPSVRNRLIEHVKALGGVTAVASLWLEGEGPGNGRGKKSRHFPGVVLAFRVRKRSP